VKAERGSAVELVAIVAQLEEALQAIADRVPSSRGVSAPSYAWDALRDLRREALTSLGE
jgi:hypothetical protein